MRKPLLIIVLLITVIYACNRSKQEVKNSLLVTSALPSEFFSIDITRDTTLLTKKRALIHIPRNAISSAQGNNIKLEVKEAYSMQDIIRGGLITESNGEPLSSGGMIYINPAEGVDAKLNGAISIATPTEYVNEEMNLYKGETEADGVINWKDTLPMPASKASIAVQKGEQIFADNCARCHSLTKDLAGPSLMHVESRGPSKELMYEFTKNSVHVLTMGEEYADRPSNRYYNCLWEKWNRTPMPPFQLTDEELDNLYAYIDNASRMFGPPPPRSTIASCYDSCDAYQKVKDGLLELRSALVIDNGKLTEEYRVFETTDTSQLDSTMKKLLDSCGNCFPELVIPKSNYAEYYQFKIESFGWYNIDIPLHLLEGALPGKLTVKVTENSKANFDIYLVLPYFKVFTLGGPIEDESGVYAFYEKNGNIPLPHGINAWVFALGETSEGILFGKIGFTTSENNELELALKKITKTDFEKEIQSMGLDSMNITFGDSKNATEIRKLDRELKVAEDLKPKGCDCDCVRKDTTIY